MSPSNQNMDFWDLPASGLKKIQKISWFWVNNGKKTSMHKNFLGEKKQGMISQTVYILVYKNAIANGLRTTQKLPIQNVKQFDDMIKHNNNPMKNNFWHLFTQLISQLARMHKKINIAMTKWEQYFDKLQHGLTFDKNNPDMTDISENDNCNKKLIQNDIDPSQNKSYNKHKTHTLDECAENMVKKLRAVPKHLDIDKNKTLDVQPDSQKFPHETFNTAKKKKQNHKQNFKVFVYAAKKTFGIQKKKMSLI